MNDGADLPKVQMPDTTNPDRLLVLIADPEQTERLGDLLAEAGLDGGWFEFAIDHAGGRAPYRSRREQVRGRRARVQFQIPVTADGAETLIARLRVRLGTAMPQHWCLALQPVTAPNRAD